MEVTFAWPTLSDNTTIIILIPHNAKDLSLVDRIRSGELLFKKMYVDDRRPNYPEIWIELEG